MGAPLLAQRLAPRPAGSQLLLLLALLAVIATPMAYVALTGRAAGRFLPWVAAAAGGVSPRSCRPGGKPSTNSHARQLAVAHSESAPLLPAGGAQQAPTTLLRLRRGLPLRQPPAVPREHASAALPEGGTAVEQARGAAGHAAGDAEEQPAAAAEAAAAKAAAAAAKADADGEEEPVQPDSELAEEEARAADEQQLQQDEEEEEEEVRHAAATQPTQQPQQQQKGQPQPQPRPQQPPTRKGKAQEVVGARIDESEDEEERAEIALELALTFKSEREGPVGAPAAVVEPQELFPWQVRGAAGLPCV